GPHAVAVVAHRLRGPGSDVPGNQVPERGVAAFQEVVPLRFGDLVGRAGVALLLGGPDPAVVAQALAHEGELGLALARLGQARGVDLGEARVGEEGALLVAAPYRGRVAVDRVGGQVKDGGVAARGHAHRVGRVRVPFAGDKVASDDATGPAVADDHLQT